MATFADQKTRIATELVRDDIASGGALESLLEQHYQDAVEYYASERYWFNAIVTTVNTVAGTQTVALPSGVRKVERVTYPADDRELIETILGELNDSDTSGSPEYYAYYNDSLRLYPKPDAVYTLNIYGVAEIAAPTTGTDTNIWTNEAAPLIRAHTKLTLCRSVFRDPEGTQLAMAETADARQALRRETTRRLVSKLRMPADAPFGYNRFHWHLG